LQPLNHAAFFRLFERSAGNIRPEPFPTSFLHRFDLDRVQGVPDRRRAFARSWESPMTRPEIARDGDGGHWPGTIPKIQVHS
jgi:hypothetical protein